MFQRADQEKGIVIPLNLKRLPSLNLDFILNGPGVSGNPEIPVRDFFKEGKITDCRRLTYSFKKLSRFP